MSITTPDEAKEKVSQWLTENGHDVNVIKDENATFHYEIDYPTASKKRQRIIQPKEYKDLILLLNGVSIAEEHKEKIAAMNEDDRDSFYDGVKKGLLFLENSFDMNTDDSDVVQQVQISYEFYFDALTKTQLFKALLLNHRTLLYIVTIFNEKFGIPAMPTEPPKPQAVQ